MIQTFSCVLTRLLAEVRPTLTHMKKTTKQSPKRGGAQRAETDLLALLKKVLPRATDDQQLATRIYKAVETELKSKSKAAAFEMFCARLEVPSLDAKTLQDIQLQLASAFGEGDLTLKPNKAEKSLAVEVTMPDGTSFRSELKVDPNAGKTVGGEDGEEEFTPKFVPFPVCLPGDKELVWMLAKRENMTPEEAGIQLNKVEEEFWASKSGQKMIRDRVEKSFPEFIQRAPAGLLQEAGLKRHYKTPEPLKQLRPGAPPRR